MLPPETARAWGSATDAELIIAQIQAIDAWHRTWPARDDPHPAETSREGRLERVRQLETLRAVQAALQEHAALRLAQETHAMRLEAQPRAVVALRDTSYRDGLTDALEAYGIAMVARLNNGAEALGVAIAEQPDLLLVEDAMSYLRGEEVLREVLQFSPRTLVAIQADGARRAAALEAAGADAVIPRQVAAVDVAHDLAALVEAHRASQP